MSKDIRRINLIEITPESLKHNPVISAAAQTIEQSLQMVSDEIEKCLLLPRLDDLPEVLLDLLAWQWHVDFYEPIGISIPRKRELIRRSIAQHRYKGTPAAVEEVVKAAYGNCALSEWFDYGGKPYFFKVAVTLEDESTDKGRWKKVISAINAVKNTRSWMEEILFYYPTIHLPIEIHHRAEAMQFIDAHQCIWNLGTAEIAHRDGQFRRDKTTRRNGINPLGNWRQQQVHRTEIDLLVDSHMDGSARKINIRDGAYRRDGSHRRNGGHLARTMITHCCTITYIKNGVEVTENV